MKVIFLQAVQAVVIVAVLEVQVQALLREEVVETKLYLTEKTKQITKANSFYK
jgi:hypothetical protein